MSRLPVVFTVAAAVALGGPSVLALATNGAVDLLGWMWVVVLLFTAWRLSRRSPWARWLLAVWAFLAIMGAWQAWQLAPFLAGLVPQFRFWEGGRLAAALLLVIATAAAWFPLRSQSPVKV